MNFTHAGLSFHQQWEKCRNDYWKMRMKLTGCIKHLHLWVFVLTCIHKTCHHSCLATPHLGEGPLFPLLLTKWKKDKILHIFHRHISTFLTCQINVRFLVTTKPYMLLYVMVEKTMAQGKKEKVIGALGDNENLMRKQRTELCFTVFCWRAKRSLHRRQPDGY